MSGERTADELGMIWERGFFQIIWRVRTQEMKAALKQRASTDVLTEADSKYGRRWRRGRKQRNVRRCLRNIEKRWMGCGDAAEFWR